MSIHKEDAMGIHCRQHHYFVTCPLYNYSYGRSIETQSSNETLCLFVFFISSNLCVNFKHSTMGIYKTNLSESYGLINCAGACWKSIETLNLPF